MRPDEARNEAPDQVPAAGDGFGIHSLKPFTLSLSKRSAAQRKASTGSAQTGEE
jgi:hypothetical protein